MWILSILLRGGYEHEKAAAAISGGEFSGTEPPTAETLENLYVLSDLSDLESQIFRAIGAGSHPDVQIKSDSKNAEATLDQ